MFKFFNSIYIYFVCVFEKCYRVKYFRILIAHFLIRIFISMKTIFQQTLEEHCMRLRHHLTQLPTTFENYTS